MSNRFQLFLFALLAAAIASPSLGQGLSSFGLPAIIADPGANGQTEYSLSLQILALMTAA